jgi:serine-type D-Ala-D-Ala carboxypeptidase/endopeptidase (penicillin-binding protein 4)
LKNTSCVAVDAQGKSRRLWMQRSCPTPTTQPWSAADLKRLHAELRDAFAPAIDGADGWSLAVLAADGRTIYGDRAYRAVAPASVQKLIVAATALDVLGPRFRFHTILAGEHAVASDGSLEGNLWLVGSGDPSFRSLDLDAGVKMLAMAGLRSVSGSVAVDADSMHGPELNPHWDPDDEGEDYAAPTSAVSIDGDTVEFDVTGTSPGAPAEVQVVPPNDAVVTSGEIVTGSSEAEDNVTIAPQSTPNAFALGGSVPSDAREKYWLPVRGVATYAGAVLDRMLRERDIQAAGGPIVAPAPLDSIVLWDHASTALRALEAHMLYVSDNHYAEQLLRTVGGERTGTSSDATGIATELRFLSERGIPTPGLRLLDGSGLADGNRVAAITLARILSDSELRGGEASLYLLLPLGGRQGTIREYDFTNALGRVRAKSGHITGVASLAGFVNTFHHGRLEFAFSVDGSPGDPDAAIVRAVDRLAEL